MASTTAYASLSVPAPEDTMEVSSPANRHFDGDIDIDFEDTYDAVQFTDDERMLEDEHTRPGTATDEMMQDDEHNPSALVSEEVMQDDDHVPNPVTHQDEDQELIDYDDEEYMEDNSNVANGVVSDVTGPTEKAVDGYAADSEQLIEVIELPEVEAVKEPEPSSPTKTEDHATPKAQQPIDLATEQEVPESTKNVDQVASKPEEAVEISDRVDGQVQENPTVTGSVTYEEPGEGKVSPVDKPPKISTNLDTSSITKADGPPTPTDTGLHPMTVRWRGQSMPLFKSRLQSDGLLKDDNLVNLSLADLLSNCRERLATKLGDSVPSDEDLVLTFDLLSLTVVEDSQACFATSLNDILEVYLQLQQNDGIHEIPSLSISLSVQPKFHSLLMFLKESAAQGQGMSIAEALYNATTEDDFYDEDGVTGVDGDGNENTNVEHEDEGLDHHGTNDQADVQHDAEEIYLEGEEDNDEDYYNGEDTEDYNHDQNNSVPEGDPNDEHGVTEATGDHENADLQYEYAEGEKPTDDNVGVEEYDFEADVGDGSADVQAEDQTYSQAVEPANQTVPPPQPQTAAVEPGADSTKVRTDTASDRAATTGPGQNSISTVVADEDHDDGKPAEPLQGVAGSGVEESDVLESLDAGLEENDDFYLDSDALLKEESVQDVGEGLDVKQTGNAEDLFNDDAGDEYGTNDQTNGLNNGNQDDGIQSGENDDDEHFHTAYDLLDEPGAYSDSQDQAPAGSHADDGHELYGEDEIDFDDEEDFLPAATSPAHKSAASDAPSTKRAFNNLAELDDEEHEAKKARAA